MMLLLAVHGERYVNAAQLLKMSMTSLRSSNESSKASSNESFLLLMSPAMIVWVLLVARRV